MDFGIAVAPSAHSWKIVQRAEELGFASAWFYDSPLMYADLFVAMAAAAAQTSRIRLGAGVLVPFHRTAPVAANALASLNELAPGRIDFGVGVGNTGRRAIGLAPVRLEDLREYVRVVEGLLAAETVEWESEERRRKIAFLAHERGLVNLRDPVYLHVAAHGPRSIELAAELGERWIHFASDLQTALVGLITMQDAWHDAGRDASACYSSLFFLGCVLGEGEPYDSERAIAQAGPDVAAGLHGKKAGPPGDESAPYRGHLMFVRPEERPFVTAEAIREQTFTGTLDELAERARILRNAGYAQLVVQIVNGQEDAIEDWAAVMAAV